jgi:hypothetical protein
VLDPGSTSYEHNRQSVVRRPVSHDGVEFLIWNPSSIQICKCHRPITAPTYWERTLSHFFSIGPSASSSRPISGPANRCLTQGCKRAAAQPSTYTASNAFGHRRPHVHTMVSLLKNVFYPDLGEIEYVRCWVWRFVSIRFRVFGVSAAFRICIKTLISPDWVIQGTYWLRIRRVRRFLEMTMMKSWLDSRSRNAASIWH